MWKKIQATQLKLHAILGPFKHAFNSIIFIMSEISYVYGVLAVWSLCLLQVIVNS